MPRHAEDISKIEDIGQRLDALLDALETSSSEVARIGSDLDKPLEELLAEEPAAKAEASPAQSPESEVDAQEPEAEPVAVDEVGPEPELEDAVLDNVVEQRAANVDSEPVDEAEPGAVDDTDPEPEAEAETEIDDGLLIEPETYAEASESDDIDGAPVGPLSLEEELDEELESLLASGMFEDPLAEMGVDESAEQLELPEDPPPPVETAPEPASERKPNLPTDEAELIGELDEQLAALADAQLTEDEPPETEKASEPVEAPKVEPRHAPAAVAPEVKPEPAGEPEIVTKPVAPAPVPKHGWKLHADRAWRVAKPAAETALVRTGKLAVAGATRASAPLKDKPQLKQIVGWVGLVQAFLAGCVWAYLMLWHNPPAPAAETPQPTIVAPSER